jgi:dihydroorotate dehydrogenase
MSIIYNLTKPFIFCLQPETAHWATLKYLNFGLGPKKDTYTSDILKISMWDRVFPNPLGLAAGFDKNAEALTALLGLGFGFIEAGTVTPIAQKGNPKPRIFRDTRTHSIINSMGFPNEGVIKFKKNISRHLEKAPRKQGIIGLNIGMNKTQKRPLDDYKVLVHELGPYADYLTINISSPNTPGLRDLQNPRYLSELIQVLISEREKACKISPPPILIKLSPDLENAQKKDIADVLLGSGIDGIILNNTTLDRPELLENAFAAHTGGLSGKHIKEKSTDNVRTFFRLTQGKIPIIGLGGISSAEDAYERVKAGASLLQLYSALVFHGPSVVMDILIGLENLLNKDGYTSISEAIGVEAR